MVYHKVLFGTFALAVFAVCASGYCEGADVHQVFRDERYSRGDVNLRVLQDIDEAAWIWKAVPTADLRHPMLRFRREFRGSAEPLRIDVSADARFVLLLDGKVIARGPHKGCPLLWYYETYDITGLSATDHRLEAVVFDLGDAGPLSIVTSGRNGFILKASGAYDSVLTTGKATWNVADVRCMEYGGLTDPETMTGVENIVKGTGFLDDVGLSWNEAVVVQPPVEDLGYGYRSKSWHLFPTERLDPIAVPRTPGRVRASQFAYDQTNVCYTAEDAEREWTHRFDEFVRCGNPVVVPPRTEIRFLWDFEDYYCGYPMLETDGGAGAKIRWAWAESLYNVKIEGDIHANRGHRDAFLGKVNLRSMYDTFLPDGRSGACFTVPWWKSGRWVEISVKTGDFPLMLKKIFIVETRYPFKDESTFFCDDVTVENIRRLCKRGLENCLHETFMDCPYFEQMMYPGDTRIVMQMLGAVSRDARLTRNGIGLFDYSRRNDGLLPMSCPNRGIQDSATYSMCWAMMLGDYALWHGTDDFLRARIPGMRQTLSELLRYLNDDGLLANLPGWSFVDWVPEWGTYGNAPDGRRGASAINNLLFVHALKSGAYAERVTGDHAMATYWQGQAERIGQAVFRSFWDAQRGLIADTLKKDVFSEHAQCLALLAEILPRDCAERSLLGLVSDKDLARATVYFSYYLFETYFKFGRADLFLEKLNLWRGFIAEGLKTPLEAPGWRGRSECHAWGAHPLYFMQTGIAGIKPDGCGYSSVTVAPQPGGLKMVKATSPTPAGRVSVDLSFSGGTVSGTITLPAGLPGKFIWKNESQQLNEGDNKISIRSSNKGKL